MTTILILYASVAMFGMDGVVKVQSFDNRVACEVALTEFQKVMPKAKFACIEASL